MREATVAASWPQSLLDFVVARGADRETLLQRARIQPHELADPDGRIPLLRYVALMEAGIALCNDPALALKYGEQVPMQDLSIVPFIAANAESAEDARAKINRYAALMLDGEDGDAPAVEFVHRGGMLWLRFASALYARYPVVTEAAIARLVCGARNLYRALGNHAALQLMPAAIHFTWPEPAHRKEYDRVFGVPLLFGSEVTAVVIDPAFLSVRIPRLFGAAAATATKHAERLLSRLDNSRSTRANVENALLRHFERGDVRMEAIARELGVSRATLFRRLEAEGATFEEVLQALRQERALQLLNEGKRSVRQTAHLLGFSDPAAFSRAFKRWTGVSPKEAQRGQVGS